MIGWEDVEVFEEGIMCIPQDIMPYINFRYKDFVLSRVKSFLELMALKREEGFHFYRISKCPHGQITWEPF